jgi:Ca-activated chloride channel family protein
MGSGPIWCYKVELPLRLKALQHKPIIATLLALLAAVVPVIVAQDKPVKLRADLVTVDVTVTDRDGNFIRGLTADDFTVFDEGEPQEIGFFEASEEASMTRPLAVVFSIDISGSIKPEEVPKERGAAENFMRMVRPESVFAVIAFNHEIRVLQDFTSDPQKISKAFGCIGQAAGSSKVFGSIDRAIAMLKRAPRLRNGRRLRRVVIVVTDGYDSVDPPSQAGLISRANEAEVTVYSVTLPSYQVGLMANERVLTLLDISRIVPMTGGADFSADAKDFTRAFEAISEEIRSSYTLAYYPPQDGGGRVRQIRIEVKKPGIIVKANRNNYQTLGRR